MINQQVDNLHSAETINTGIQAAQSAVNQTSVAAIGELTKIAEAKNDAINELDQKPTQCNADKKECVGVVVDLMGDLLRLKDRVTALQDQVTGADVPTVALQSEDDLTATDRGDTSEQQKRAAIAPANGGSGSSDGSNKKSKGGPLHPAFSASKRPSNCSCCFGQNHQKQPARLHLWLPQTPVRLSDLARTAAPGGTGNTRRVSSASSRPLAQAMRTPTPGPTTSRNPLLESRELGSSGHSLISQSKDAIGTNRMPHIQRENEPDYLIPGARVKGSVVHTATTAKRVRKA